MVTVEMPIKNLSNNHFVSWRETRLANLLARSSSLGNG